MGRGLAGAAVGTALAFALNVLLVTLKRARVVGGSFDVSAGVTAILNPTRAVEWVDLLGPPVAGVVVGLAVAAYVAARRGVAWGRVPVVRA